MMLLVPCDVLNGRRVDDHFAEEADAARAAGHPVALVDHDALGAGQADRAVARVPAGAARAVYRGWMLTAGAYTEFAAALAARGVTLHTSADQYRRGHELPGWYDTLQPFTPRSMWTHGAGRDDFDQARAALGPGPAVLRDYTKSMKHYWHEAVYIEDLADTEKAWTVAQRFHELRDGDFTGGFVIREFERFTGAEARTWWINGACRLISAHPDTPDQPPPTDLPLSPLTAAIGQLALPFVTVDVACRTDGEWRVIELGDGQVSDRPRSLPADLLVSHLLHAGA